jgi:hypothetical protein
VTCYTGCPDCKCDRKPQAEGIAAKLDTLEEHYPAAIFYLIDWLRAEPDVLRAIAKGRHAEGEYRFDGKGMYTMSGDRLRAEASQELADAINYVALMLAS